MEHYENGQVNWFGNEASFPAGAYKIDASGWYTHWSPRPSVTKCVDQSLDPCAGYRVTGFDIKNIIGDI